MEILFSPNPVDEPNLLYKLQNKIKVFNPTSNLPNRGYNLVANSSKYGIVFVACLEGTLSVYYLKDIIDKEGEHKHLTVKLSEKPTHISVNCDQELLAVTGGQFIHVYQIQSLQNQNVVPSASVKCDVNPSTFVSALQWNPCISDTLAVAFFDGTLLVTQVSDLQIKKIQSKARCICWSPKGKQLVVGNSDGTLCQYKPDLSPMKAVPPPNLFESAPVEVLAIYWISTYQFAAVYKKANDDNRPAVAIINTPKGGQPSCTNFEDICYSIGSNRPWFYYLYGLPQWNIILSASSNSMEIATLGSSDGATWIQWCQSDEARPELPLTDKKQENYPVGVSIDTTAIHQLPWGENETLPHMPLLLVVSQSGLLTVFNLINLNKAAPNVCTPPQQIALPANMMTSDIPGVSAVQPTQPPQAPQATLQPQSPPIAQPLPQPVAQPIAQPQPVTQPIAQPISQLAQVLSQPAKPGHSLFAPTSQFTSLSSGQPAKPFGLTQQPSQNLAASAVPTSTLTTLTQQKQSVLTAPAQQPTSAPKPATQPVAQSQSKPESAQAQEVSAALKAEQEKISKARAQQELKNIQNMLLKEVNDFQMEMYKFMIKTRETQVKLQNELNSLENNFDLQSMSTEQLKKDCCLDELRDNIVQLKLELVRACAVVAEARTHAEANDQHWSLMDPLTVKRMASIKKLAYYVQSQLELAQKALDYKWSQYENRDLRSDKSGPPRMIRPIMDDVYQPLVKQQEILGRQQAVLRALKNTLNECNTGSLFKSTSLLRSTPFKKDPLSKLTKNILNMSIESQTHTEKQPGLSAQKLDALKDMLSNRKTVKIKPVAVELKQHLAVVRTNYEKSLKDKPIQKNTLPKAEPVKPKTEPVQPNREPVTAELKTKPFIQAPVPALQPKEFIKVEPKHQQQPIKQPQKSASSFTPVANVPKPTYPGFNNVARTLFTEEPKQEESKPAPIAPQLQPQTQKPLSFGTKPFSFAPAPTVEAKPTEPNSLLKGLLQNPSPPKELTSDANTFMGQKICAPSAFAVSSTPVTSSTSSSFFTLKPKSDAPSIFGKPQAVTPAESEPQIVKPSSSETGELEAIVDNSKQNETKKEDTPLTSLFKMTTSPQYTPNVPDVLKSQGVTITKVETSKPAPKTIEKVAEKITKKLSEKSKENDPEGSITENVKQDNKENTVKPLSKQTNNKSVLGTSSETININQDSTPSETPKLIESKEEKKEPTVPKTDSQTKTSIASSIFASANASSEKSQSAFSSSIFGAKLSETAASTTTTVSTSQSAISSTTSSSIFAAAVAQNPNSETTPTQPASIFSGNKSPTTTPSSIFAQSNQTQSQPQSIFGATTQTSVFGTTSQSPASIFSSAVASSPTTQSLFGTQPTTTVSTSASIFGNSSPASVFASAVTPTSTPQSVFGSATTTSQSIFGGNSQSQTVFGSSQSSVFATATTQSVFGSPSTTTQSVFGTPTASTQASVFGTPTQSTQASVFGTPTQATQASIFGTPTQATQASVFGTPPPATTSQSGSLFGNTDNLFASASISTTSATTPPSGGSIFGGGSPSAFGSSSNGNIFGGKSTFGQPNPTAAALFGGASASFGQKPQAQQQQTNFWGSSNTSGNTGFGSGFGQQATTQASSIFGGGGGSFSTPSTQGQAFGAPQTGSIFGTPQQSTTGFGGSPGFGSKPAFGQSAGFGSPQAPGSGFGSGFGSAFNKSPNAGFGSSATFGGGASFGAPAFGSSSPGKMFGGGGSSPGFGAPTQQSNATFESLATQNTLTFGNLAQQSGQPTAQAPSFNASPSFTGWRS